MEKLYSRRADIEVHPIALKAIEYFFKDEKRSFAHEELEDLKSMIYGVSLGEVDELAWASKSITRLIVHLDLDLGCSEAARQLLEALSVALPAMRAANEPIFQAVRYELELEKSRDFREFTGAAESAKTAPEEGAATPKGSVALHDLRPRRVFR